MMEVGGQRVVFGTSEDMQQVEDGSVTLFVTSPPYWNLKDYGHSGQIGDSGYEDYLEALARVWDQCFLKARDGAVLVVNVNSRRHRKRFYPIAFDVARTIRGWRLWDHLVWYVPNALPQPNHYMERLFDNKFESLLVFIKGDADRYKFHKPRVPQKYAVADPRAHKKNQRGRCIGNVIRIPAYRPPNVKKLGYHVAAYPEELAAVLVESFSDPGDTVLDPFLGSGTTLKVARVMGRKGIGFELNRDFEPLIRNRILEPWTVPDWKTLDVLHSSTMNTGMQAPRKVQFHKGRKDATRAPRAPPRRGRSP
jgi:DNA modification methylase